MPLDTVIVFLDTSKQRKKSIQTEFELTMPGNHA